MTNLAEFQQIVASLQPIAVSPNEAARLVGIGRTTLYAALATGALRSAKIGKRRLITIDALRQWLSACETDQPDGR